MTCEKEEKSAQLLSAPVVACGALGPELQPVGSDMVTVVATAAVVEEGREATPAAPAEVPVSMGISSKLAVHTGPAITSGTRDRRGEEGRGREDGWRGGGG